MMGLAMEDVGIFYLWLFGVFCGNYGHLVYFSRLGMLHQEKSGNPALSMIVAGPGHCTYNEQLTHSYRTRGHNL
jgi:hypothetical protein